MRVIYICFSLLCGSTAYSESYVLSEGYLDDDEIVLVSTEMVVEKKGDHYVVRGKLKSDYGGKTARLVLKPRNKEIIDVTFQFEWMFDGQTWHTQYSSQLHLDNPDHFETNPLTDILIYLEGTVIEAVDGEKTRGKFVLMKVTGNKKPKQTE